MGLVTGRKMLINMFMGICSFELSRGGRSYNSNGKIEHSIFSLRTNDAIQLGRGQKGLLKILILAQMLNVQ